MEQSPEVKFKRNINSVGSGLWIYIALQMFLSLNLTLFSDFMEERESFVFFIVSFLSGFLVILYLKGRFKISLEKEVRKPTKVSAVIIGFCLMMLVSFGWGIIQTFLEDLLGMGIPEPDFGFDSIFIEKIFSLLTVVFVAPIMEELVFRGLIYGQLRKYNVVFGIIASSLCFGMMHMNLSQGVPTVFMGIILAYFYETTGSLKTSILIHFLNNLVATIPDFFTSEYLLSAIILVADAIAILWLIKNRKQISLFFREKKDEKHYMRDFITSPVIIGIIILFVFMTLLDFM